MGKNYYIYSGKEQPRVRVQTARAKSHSVLGLVTAVFAVTGIVYAYIFASGTLRAHEERAVYEHLDGMYVAGLGDATHVFAQTMENSVVAGILGLEYMNGGDSVYTFNIENQ